MNEKELLHKTKKAYYSMLDRCKPTYSSSKYYYDKGITVCERWKKSFDNFLQDMKLCGENLSLDRKNNNDGYHKDNCRWVSANIQSWNRDWGPYKGVTWHPVLKKWRARLTYSGKDFFLGYYDDKDKAKEVYDSHARIIDWLIDSELLK